MEQYTVYFEIYGKKMKTTVTADTFEQAMDIVKSKIVIHDVRVSESNKEMMENLTKETQDIMDIFGNIFGGK